MFRICIETVLYVGVDMFLDFWCDMDFWLLSCYGIMDILISPLGLLVGVEVVVDQPAFPLALVVRIVFPQWGR